MKRIVLFVEGEGEVASVPHLVNMLLRNQSADDVVYLDDKPFRVGEVGRLAKGGYVRWTPKIGQSDKVAHPTGMNLSGGPGDGQEAT